MTGSIGILNVGAGDTKLIFDKANPAETIRAARIVKDMLRRGYALLIEHVGADGTKSWERVRDFREDTCEYVIADFDPVVAAEADSVTVTIGGTERDLEQGEEEAVGESEAAEGAAPPERSRHDSSGRGAKRGPKPGARRTKAVAADTTRGVAVARTAGG